MGVAQDAWKVLVGRDLGRGGVGMKGALVEWMRGRLESTVNWIDASFYGLAVVPVAFGLLAASLIRVSKVTHSRGK